VMVALILVQDQPYTALIRAQLVYAMPIVALTVGGLMVSRLPYRRFGRSLLLGRQPFGTFVVVMFLIAVFWSYKAAALGIAVLLYAMSGPVAWVLHRVRARRGKQSATPAAREQHSKKQA